MRIIFVGDSVLLYAGDELVAELPREEYEAFSAEPTLEDVMDDDPSAPKMWMLDDFDTGNTTFGSPKSDIVREWTKWALNQEVDPEIIEWLRKPFDYGAEDGNS